PDVDLRITSVELLRKKRDKTAEEQALYRAYAYVAQNKGKFAGKKGEKPWHVALAKAGLDPNRYKGTMDRDRVLYVLGNAARAGLKFGVIQMQAQAEQARQRPRASSWEEPLEVQLLQAYRAVNGKQFDDPFSNWIAALQAAGIVPYLHLDKF